jgi:ABC-type branched-subunit amino acid transport system substrate-binding protein
VPFYPDFETEGRVVAHYIRNTKPEAKIGILFQNDDFGRNYMKGLRAGLGPKATQIIAEASYELADPTIDSQIVQLKAAGVDTLIEQSSAKAAAQSIRKVRELNGTPLHVIGGSTASIETVLRPAGLEASKGLVTDALPQAARRSRLGRRCRSEGLSRLPEEIRAVCQPGRLFGPRRLHECERAHDGAEEMR